VTGQLLAEARKMRSTRTNLGLLAGMMALIVLVVLVNGFALDELELWKREMQHALLSVGTSGALFAALIGVMAITSEFRHGTIRSTFVVTPRRTRVVAAKVVASLIMGILFGLVAIGLSLGLGYAVLSIRGVSLLLGTGHLVEIALGTLAMTALWAAIGVGVGAVVRNQVFAVVGLIAWVLIVENLLVGLLPEVGRFTASGASASVTADPSEHLLGPVAGGLLLVGYVVALDVAGALLVARRDVT
jgi:ABC-2 type transport system permease protein